MLKYFCYTALLFLSTDNLFSQPQKPKLLLSQPINDTLSVSVLEVNVEDWLEFLVANNYNESLFPDSTIIRDYWYSILFDDIRNQFRLIEPQKSRPFFRQIKSPLGFNIKPPMKDSIKLREENPFILPITGISFTQAQAFCKWKEDYINSVSKAKLKVSIQLPSVELLKTLIPNSDSLSKEGCKDCKCFLVNYAHPKCLGKGKREYLSLEGLNAVRVDAYLPTKEGLYCIQGNVAEMTDEEGIAMGGSYKHTARESFNDHFQNYHKPEAWLGFRYIIVYKQLKRLV